MIASLVATVAAVAAAQPAGAVRTSRSDDLPAMTVSPNWSGYVVTGTAGNPISYTSVTGTWTVPTATCGARDAGASSTVWIGLGGYTTKRQEEVGTDTNCDAAGKPTYYAWFELVPYIAYPIKNKVSAGDTITGVVRILSSTLVELQVQNRTMGWTFTRDITFSTQDTSTAEWISEAPVNCLRFACTEANLANFGSVTMREISATGNGVSGTLFDPDWTLIPIQLVPSRLTVPTLNPEAPSSGTGKASSPAGATPGAPSAGGNLFSINWVAVATRGL